MEEKLVNITMADHDGTMDGCLCVALSRIVSVFVYLSNLQYSLSYYIHQGRITEYSAVQSKNFFTSFYKPRNFFRDFDQRSSSSLWSLEETEAREAHRNTRG